MGQYLSVSVSHRTALTVSSLCSTASQSTPRNHLCCFTSATPCCVGHTHPLTTHTTDHNSESTYLECPESAGDVARQQLLDEVLCVRVHHARLGPLDLALQDLLVDAEWVLVKEGRVAAGKRNQ